MSASVHYRAFFDTVARCLQPDGVALLHAIGRSDGPGSTNPWIAKYIFPGGYCPALSEVLPPIEPAAWWRPTSRSCGCTMPRRCATGAVVSPPTATRSRTLYDERFCRMFEFYLAGCEISFRREDNMVFQIQLAHRQTAVPLTRDYIADSERTHGARLGTARVGGIGIAFRPRRAGLSPRGARGMIPPLLRTRRFLPLFVTQFLGALNDNMFKNALVVLALFQAGSKGPVLVAAAGGVFILPYVLFASIAGELADRYDKARLIRLMKWWECALMVTAAVGFLTGEIGFLMVVLFGLGVQATFFSPLKYGILPDHLGADEIVAGNGYIEAGTYVGILVGTIAGAALIRDARGSGGRFGRRVAVAVAGLLVARAIPPAPPSGRGVASAGTWRARPGASGARAARYGDLARGAGDFLVLDGRTGVADAIPGGGEGRARR